MTLRSFKRRIISNFVVSFFLLISVFVAYLVWSERVYLYRESTLQAEALAKSLAVNSLSWVLANDVAGLREVVAALQAYPELRYAMVLSLKGRVLAHTDTPLTGRFLTDQPSLNLLQSDATPQLMSDTPTLIDVAVPIALNGRQVGWARIGLSRAQIVEKLDRMIQGSLLFVMVSLGLSLLEALAIGRSLGDRVSSLTKIAETIQNGERGLRVNIRGDDEIAQLTQAFNGMLDALATSEMRFRALFEQAAVGVAQLEADSGRFIRVNRRYCEITGYSPEELLACTLQDITHPGDRQTDISLMESLIEGKAKEYQREKRYLRKDGAVVWVEITVSALGNLGIPPCHVVAVVQDITPKMQAQEELLKLNQELEQRVRQESQKSREKDLMLIQQSRLAAMGEMVHNIAHQWRQPLNALSIILNNIKDDFDYGELTADSLAENIAKSRRLIQRMSTTVDDFRDFFRPDKEPSAFALAQALEDALFIVSDSLRNNGITLEKQLTPDLIAFGYPNQLAQAILNLLLNAKDAIMEHPVASGKISLSLIQSGDQAILTVQDNAGGIDEAILPKIFDPYFTTKEQGSGIGLYMTKMIVERNMKGTITASNHGEGALLTVTIPLCPA